MQIRYANKTQIIKKVFEIETFNIAIFDIEIFDIAISSAAIYSIEIFSIAMLVQGMARCFDFIFCCLLGSVLRSGWTFGLETWSCWKTMTL